MIFSSTLYFLVLSLLTSSWEQINMESTTKIDVLAQLQQKAIKKQYRKICPEHNLDANTVQGILVTSSMDITIFLS